MLWNDSPAAHLFDLFTLLSFLSVKEISNTNSDIRVNQDIVEGYPIIVCARMLCMGTLFYLLTALVAIFAASVILVTGAAL